MSLPLDERFPRHAYLPGWDHERLRQATVIILGVGALGNAVVQCLTLAGVGRLVLYDPDCIESSNLSRTPLFRERDIGRCTLLPSSGLETWPHLPVLTLVPWTRGVCLVAVWRL